MRLLSRVLIAIQRVQLGVSHLSMGEMTAASALRMSEGFDPRASANLCLRSWPRRCIALLILVLSSAAHGQQNQIAHTFQTSSAAL